MEKLGEESAAKFINALIKSVQTLCHGYLDFQNGVEIIGHINLNVDKGSSLDYILKEKVCKNAENSTLFISNSFHAEPKPDQDVSGKTSQSGNQVAQNNESSDAAETGRVSSAISSISTALTESRERLRRNSGARDSNSFHSLPNTAKRKASEEENSECHPAKISYHDRLSHVTSESSYPAETSSPIDSKEALLALRTAESDLSETVLPQTASVRSDGSDIGVNLAGSVLEPVEGQLNADLPEREEDSDGDLEVTFIKEEYVEGEGSACDFDGQQFASGQHQRGSDGMPDPSLFSMGPQSSSAPATYVPSAAGQQFPVSGSSSSASQPQPGPSGMRGFPVDCAGSPSLTGNEGDTFRGPPPSLTGNEAVEFRGPVTVASNQGITFKGPTTMAGSQGVPFKGLPSVIGNEGVAFKESPLSGNEGVTFKGSSLSGNQGVSFKGPVTVASNQGVAFHSASPGHPSSGMGFSGGSGRLQGHGLGYSGGPASPSGVFTSSPSGSGSSYHQAPADSLRGAPPGSRRLFVCQECAMTFTSASGLRNHEKRVHQQQWKFSCHICEKKFMFKEHYEGHLNMHFNIKAFKCPNCPKVFAYKTGVSLHLRNGSCGGGAGQQSYSKTE